MDNGKLASFNLKTSEPVLVTVTEDLNEMFGLTILMEKKDDEIKLYTDLTNDEYEAIADGVLDSCEDSRERSISVKTLTQQPIDAATDCTGIHRNKEKEEYLRDEFPPDIQRASWTKSAMRALIGYYSDCQAEYASTTSTKKAFSKKISSLMQSGNFFFTSMQCKDKFAKLKSKYVKKVDNMRANRNSGAGREDCEFFDELDALFRKKPNIYPEFIASSRHGCSTVSNPDIDQADSQSNISPTTICEDFSPTSPVASVSTETSSGQANYGTHVTTGCQIVALIFPQVRDKESYEESEQPPKKRLVKKKIRLTTAEIILQESQQNQVNRDRRHKEKMILQACEELKELTAALKRSLENQEDEQNKENSH